jgi:hypothetical protein
MAGISLREAAASAKSRLPLFSVASGAEASRRYSAPVQAPLRRRGRNHRAETGSARLLRHETAVPGESIEGRGEAPRTAGLNEMIQACRLPRLESFGFSCPVTRIYLPCRGDLSFADEDGLSGDQTASVARPFAFEAPADAIAWCSVGQHLTHAGKLRRYANNRCRCCHSQRANAFTQAGPRIVERGADGAMPKNLIPMECLDKRTPIFEHWVFNFARR